MKPSQETLDGLWDDALIERAWECKVRIEECEFNLEHAEDLEWSQRRIDSERFTMQVLRDLLSAYKTERIRRCV